MVQPAYYNEVDPYAATWLRNLIAAGLVPAGDVDERSIVDVESRDLAGYAQCHFFAGIGGWPYALRLGGWPNDRPVWTGSCPCQPLSSAGQRKGHADERHLWPSFYRLIAERRPATVFGEQVAGKLGREWLAGVRADLEGAGYAIGAADLCAAGVGAPHIRQRLFWVANSENERHTRPVQKPSRESGWRPAEFGMASGTGRLADSDQRERGRVTDRERSFSDGSPTGWQQGYGIAESGCSTIGLADADCTTDQRQCPRILASQGAETDRGGDGLGSGSRVSREGAAERSGVGFWSGAEWLPCLDGKARRVEPGIFPLADGVSGRVGKLRAAGNAIVPQVAARFIAAAMEIVA